MSDKDITAVRIPDALREDIDILADREGMSRSDVIREALEVIVQLNPVGDEERAKWRQGERRKVRRLRTPVVSNRPTPSEGKDGGDGGIRRRERRGTHLSVRPGSGGPESQNKTE